MPVFFLNLLPFPIFYVDFLISYKFSYMFVSVVIKILASHCALTTAWKQQSLQDADSGFSEKLLEVFL